MPDLLGPLNVVDSLTNINSYIELGPIEPGTNGKTPYINFHLGTGSAEDFNMRVINSQNRRLDFVTQLDGTMLSLNAGNVGIGTANARTQLHVQAAKGGVANPQNHAVLIENTAGGNADVLCLKANSASPAGDNNFITF